MATRYITRSLEPVLKKAASEFPAVILTGPRQSGKTTLLQHLFGKNHRYVSLEAPDVRAAAAQDPRGFLDMHPPPVIFDEVQYAPDLLPYVKERIDQDRDRCGRYLLSSSQNLQLLQNVTESLAGQAAMLRLLPLSRREADGRAQAPLSWESPFRNRRAAVGRRSVSFQGIWQGFLRGSYPELVAKPARDINPWHAAYVQRYLERDVRTIRQMGDLSQFQSFLRALAARSAGLMNLTDLARDLGVAVNTVKAWLSLLEATYQVIVLRPYVADVGKRLVKTSKIYFTDVGTLCYLTGLKDPEHAASGPLGGAIMETAVLSEIVKTLTHRGLDPRVYFWRTSTGTEVDIVIEHEGGLVPIEVNVSSTPRSAMASSIAAFQEVFGDKVLPGYVVHSGNVRLPLGRGVTALPFSEL